MLMALLTPVAWGLGGAFVGPNGAALSSSDATVVAIVADGGRLTLTVTARAAFELPEAAYLWPAPGLDRASLASPEPDGLEHLEGFTRARVEEITCDELVETVRYRTPPGCASYEVPIPEPDPRGEDAADAVGVRLDTIAADPELVVVEAADLDAWLEDMGLDPAPEARDALAPWIDAGVPFVVTRLRARIPQGAWLPPIRFALDADEIELPLLPGAALARTTHELTVLTVATGEVGDPTVPNYPEQAVRAECLLPPATGAETLWDEMLGAGRGAPVPPWLPVYAGPADRCAPCSGEPLTTLDLVDLGIPGAEPADVRLGRLVMRHGPGELDQDPRLDFAAPRVDLQTRWIARTDGLGFAYETCGDGLDPDDVCPELRLPDGGGCAVGPRAPALALLGALLLLRARRLAPLLLLLIPLAGHAKEPTPPRTEVLGSVSMLGTNRVIVAPGSGGPPGVTRPYLGLEARRGLLGKVGIIGGVKGWRGRAGEQRFTLVEPSLGIDLRYGRMREGSTFEPYGRVGGRLAFTVLDPDVMPPLSAITSLFHLGAGAWVGRGAIRPSIELRGAVLPRTDGYVTSFLPATQLQGWTFYPGSANVEILFGAAFY